MMALFPEQPAGCRAEKEAILMTNAQSAPLQLSFERIEKKYLLTPAQFRLFFRALTPYMKVDRYGLHTIQNIYYDTQDFAMIRHSLSGPVYKEKFRVRSYGTPDHASQVFAEIKKKYRGVVYKRRAALPCWQLPGFLNGCTLRDSDPQIQAEIHYLLESRPLFPRCFIGYDRVAMYGIEDPSFRLTFDRNLRWRTEDLDLRAGSRGEPVLDEERVVLEIKFSQSAPLWISRLLSSLNIAPAHFSKYGCCFEKHLAGSLLLPPSGFIRPMAM